MSRSLSRYKKELGKTCNTGFITTVIAMFVTPRITGQNVSFSDYAVMAAVGVVFWLSGMFLLSEKESKSKGEGKWKRVRVKKDTTIHVMEESAE